MAALQGQLPPLASASAREYLASRGGPCLPLIDEAVVVRVEGGGEVRFYGTPWHPCPQARHPQHPRSRDWKPAVCCAAAHVAAFPLPAADAMLWRIFTAQWAHLLVGPRARLCGAYCAALRLC